MDRINGADFVDIGAGRRGFRDENLPNGLLGTEVTALFLNGVQEELMAVIEAAGLVPSPGDWSQLAKALDVRSFRRGAWCPVLSATLTAAPVTPAIGDTYAVPAGATGVWADHSGALAEYAATGWRFADMKDGHAVGMPDGTVFMRLAGAYVPFDASTALKGLVRFATPAEATAALLSSVAVTPAGLASYTRRQTADLTLYVRSDGNDGNDGSANTSGGALRTIQAAIDRANGLYSGGGYLVQIAVSAGTFASFIINYSGAMRFRVVGQGVTTIIDGAAGDQVVRIVRSSLVLESVRLTNATNLLNNSAGDIRFQAVQFGTATGAHIRAVDGGVIYAVGDYSISASAPSHATVGTLSLIGVGGVTITAPGGSYSDAFYNVNGGYILANGTVYSFTATGRRYVVTLAGLLWTNGATVPGSTAGSLSSGGQTY